MNEAELTVNDRNTAIDRNSLYAKVQRRIIPLLIAIYVAAFIDRSNIAVAKLEFMADVGLGEAAYGLGGGLFYLGYCLFEVPSNLYLAKVGARRTLMRIIILWSLCSAAFALVTNPWQFYALRFLLGAAEAGLFPGVLFYLSKWIPVGRRAAFTAMFMAAMPIAGMVTGPVSAAILASTDGMLGLHAWQWLFVIEAAPGLLLATLVYRHLAESPAQAAWLSDADKARIAMDFAVEAEGSRHTPGSGSFRHALRDYRVYMLGALAMTLMGTISGIVLWLPTILRASGVNSIVAVSLLTSLPYLAAIVGQQAVARHSDHSGERMLHIAAPAFLASLGWLALPLTAQSPAAALIVLCAIAAATFAITGPFWSLPATLFVGDAAAGGIALVTTAGGIGAFLTPIIVGRVVQAAGSIGAGHVVYAGLIGLGGLLALALHTRRNRQIA